MYVPGMKNGRIQDASTMETLREALVLKIPMHWVNVVGAGEAALWNQVRLSSLNDIRNVKTWKTGPTNSATAVNGTKLIRKKVHVVVGDLYLETEECARLRPIWLVVTAVEENFQLRLHPPCHPTMDKQMLQRLQPPVETNPIRPQRRRPRLHHHCPTRLPWLQPHHPYHR